MSNSSYTIWIELLTCEISQTKLLPNELSIAHAENSLNFIWIHHHFTNPHWKSIYFCFSFTIWFITCANFVTKKNLIFSKESTKRTLFYNKNGTGIQPIWKWITKASIFSPFCIPRSKNTQTEVNKQTKDSNFTFRFSTAKQWKFIGHLEIEKEKRFRDRNLVPDGWYSGRDLKDK